MARSDVLIITSSMIGDVIMSTGAISRILEIHKGADITVVCSPSNSGLFKNVLDQINVIAVSKRKHGAHWVELYLKLRSRRWAAIYDFRESLVGRFLSGPRLTPIRSNEGVVHKVVEASSILGDGGPLAPVLWIAPDDEASLPSVVTQAERLLVLGPGATRLGKTWPANRFAALAAKLTSWGGPLENALVVPTGGPMDRMAAEIIRNGLAPARFCDMTGASLLTTAALLTRADLFVGNDSGMMHLASAAGAPTLGLFGPTDERLYGPWGEGTATVRAQGQTFIFGKTSRTVSKTESQMVALTVDEVVCAAGGLLGLMARRPGKQRSIRQPIG